MTSHMNTPPQPSKNHLAEEDISSLSLISDEGVAALGDITSLEEVKEDSNEENDYSLANTEQEIENLLNDAALFENHKIDTSELSNLDVPVLEESIRAEPLPASSKATPKNGLKNTDDTSDIPTLSTEIKNTQNNGATPLLAPRPVPAATTDNPEAKNKLNLDDNVDSAINELASEIEALDSVINEAGQPSQFEAPHVEETPTNPPQNVTAHTTDNSSTNHISVSAEQTPTDLQAKETTVEQLASQIDQQLDDILSAPISAPISAPSQIQAIPAFEDNRFTPADNPQDIDEQPTKPAQPIPALHSEFPAKTTLSPHDELHKQLSKKMDQFIVEAAATLTDELNRQLSTRLENIILNSIDTILPSLLEQVGQSLRHEVKNNVKQHLPTLINEAMGQTTRIS